MTDLALVDMRWISDEDVRCGRDEAANFAEEVEDDSGGGVLGDVVEIARMVVMDWYVPNQRCNGTARGVVAKRRVVDLGLLSLFRKGAGHEQRCIGVGQALAGGLSEPTKVSKQKHTFTMSS